MMGDLKNAKIKENNWKVKAVERAEENRRLRKRISEIEKSRAHWKNKYLQKQLSEKKLFREHPAGHQYPVIVIWLCLYVYNSCQCSFRNCCTMVMGCSIAFQFRCKKPCAATIRNWVIKYGYYCCRQEDDDPQAHWVIIIDESVAIGQEKLLLVLGLQQNEWAFTKAISHRDVKVLHIGIAGSWKAAGITRVLQEIEKDKTIVYCVSDKGNNIMGAIKEMGWKHVYDCSHHWAKGMEKLYDQSEDFKFLMGHIGMLRKKWILSKFSHLMPPSLRSKARFQNIFPIIDWLEKIGQHWKEIPPEAQEAMNFIPTNRPLIRELKLLQDTIKQMGALLKVKGMNRQTLQACKAMLSVCKNGRPLEFKKRLLQDWEVYESGLADNQTLVISSDIIESYFGKYKQKIKQNGMQCITESVLTMGAWSQNITPAEVKMALSKIPMEEIYKWKKENTTDSLLKKRRKFFNKKCTRKCLIV